MNKMVLTSYNAYRSVYSVVENYDEKLLAPEKGRIFSIKFEIKFLN